MAIEKIPAGSRGGSIGPGPVVKLLTRLMMRVHKRSGDTFQGMDLLYLTTTGAQSGQRRTTPVARIDDGQGGWLICASAGGAQKHPAWYNNIVAHPDQVSIEFGGTKRPVKVEQLRGADRAQAWTLITTQQPRFEGYLKKTDREMPVLRLTKVTAH